MHSMAIRLLGLCDDPSAIPRLIHVHDSLYAPPGTPVRFRFVRGPVYVLVNYVARM